MEAVFLKTLNMGITASWVVLAVMAARIALKKAPKWITVLMWGLAGIRLVCPFSLESALSLIPSAQTVPSDILYTDTPAIQSGVAVLNSLVNPILSESLAPTAGASVNPMQVITFAASRIWIMGIAGMLIYTAVSYLRIHKKIREAIPFQENIWLCDHVDTPFILGVIRPRIYLPSALSAQDMEYVIAHEKAHLKRHDHWWKPLGYSLLTVHWFQPILWIAYILLCRDIELACDEKVIRDMGTQHKKQYSAALINCSVKRRTIAACPLAFGEIGVKERVKSVLNYKKPSFWILAVAVTACIAAAVCLLTNPKSTSRNPDLLTPQQLQLLTEKYPEYLGVDASNGLDIYVWQMAEDSYSFGLLPHSEAYRNDTSPELLELMNQKGANASEMRQIIAAYNMDENDIYIIPWQNPLSSYIGEYWIISDGESTEEKQGRYVQSIRSMLFGNQEEASEEPAIYDAMIFDVDGDGKDEYCVLGYGSTSGLFTFTFSASETGAVQPEYHNLFYTQWYDLSFVKCDDGVVRVQGIDQKEVTQIHLFDITVADGNVHLTEVGQGIGELVVSFPIVSHPE